MKKIYLFLLLIFFQPIYSQSDGLNIQLLAVRFDPDLLGGVYSYGADGTEKDKLVTLYLTLQIDGFNETTPIDFNLFSIVEHQNKLRHRPSRVTFRHYEISKCNIDSVSKNDPFIMYSQPGIENYDHYYYEKTGAFNKSTNSRQRFYLLRMPAKKNKKKKFYLQVPVKIRKQGEFTLYYKDQVVKTFIATKNLTEF